MSTGGITELLKRSEERLSSRDKIGNFEVAYCRRRWDAPTLRPVVDEELERSVPGFPKKLKWPGGARFAALLSHDVDGLRDNDRVQLWRVMQLNIRHSQGLMKKLHHFTSLSGLRHRPSNQDLLSPWMEKEASCGFHSTFFLFPSNVRKRNVRDLTYKWQDLMPFDGGLRTVQEVFKEVQARGWEVGVHSSVHAAYQVEMLAEQREDVSKALGCEVFSNRQHNLQFDVASTPDYLARAGYGCDCTLGSNRDVFFRSGSCYPAPLWSWRESRWLPVYEIPLILHDGALMRWDNLDLDSEIAFEFGKAIVDRVAKVRGVLSLLWHPENLVKPGYFEVYCKLLDYIRDQNGWGSSAREIIEWWKSSGNAEAHGKALCKIGMEPPFPQNRKKA